MGVATTFDVEITQSSESENAAYSRAIQQWYNCSTACKLNNIVYNYTS